MKTLSTILLIMFVYSSSAQTGRSFLSEPTETDVLSKIEFSIFNTDEEGNDPPISNLLPEIELNRMLAQERASYLITSNPTMNFGFDTAKELTPFFGTTNVYNFDMFGLKATNTMMFDTNGRLRNSELSFSIGRNK